MGHDGYSTRPEEICEQALEQLVVVDVIPLNGMVVPQQVAAVSAVLTVDSSDARYPSGNRTLSI